MALFMKSWGSAWQKLTTVFFHVVVFFYIILLQYFLVVYSQELSQDGKKLRKPIHTAKSLVDHFLNGIPHVDVVVAVVVVFSPHRCKRLP